MFHYFKFFHYYLIFFISMACLLLGSHFIWLGFVFFASIYVFGDLILGDDVSNPELSNTRLLNTLLYGALPVCMAIFAVNMHMVSPWNWTIVDFMSEYFHYDFVRAKSESTWWQLVINVVYSGFLFATTAIVVGHELVHRLRSQLSICLGRWLLSLCFDANFSIEHVYHHHAKVATPEDPATAPRGRNVYSHLVRALVQTNLSAWKLETKRLARNDKPIWSIQNACIRGWAMSLFWLICAFLLASWQGVVYFSAIAIFAKLILETVNYMEHYGLVRDPKKPVLPKHSWNTNRKISCWAMFNLPRHSHHHAQASVPFYKLQAMDDAPTMISGYISTIVVVLIPPLWFKLMAPKLKHWDAHYASEDELSIIAQQERSKPRTIVGHLLY